MKAAILRESAQYQATAIALFPGVSVDPGGGNV